MLRPVDGVLAGAKISIISKKTTYLQKIIGLFFNFVKI